MNKCVFYGFMISHIVIVSVGTQPVPETGDESFNFNLDL
jgi:hypothetical protein